MHNHVVFAMASGKGLMQAKVCRGGAWVASDRPGEAIMLLQGDACISHWLSAIRHTPKLAGRIIVSQ